jgi:hypothetical protein
MRFWKPGDIFTVNCPRCGGEIEFFKDEPVRPCPSCKAETRNPKIDLGCAKWCKFAKECLGTLPDETMNASMVDRLTAAVEKAMGLDASALARANRALDHARRIVSAEGGDPLIVQAAVLFNEAARHSHLEQCRPFEPSADPCDTKRTLERAGLAQAAIDRVCQVLWAVHTGLEDDSPEFAAAWDAVQLTAMEAAGQPPTDVESALRTAAGQKIAREIHSRK